MLENLPHSRWNKARKRREAVWLDERKAEMSPMLLLNSLALLA